MRTVLVIGALAVSFIIAVIVIAAFSLEYLRSQREPFSPPEIAFSESDLTANWMKWFDCSYLPTWQPDIEERSYWFAGKSDIVPPGFVAIKRDDPKQKPLPAGCKVEEGEAYLVVPVREPREVGENDEATKALSELADRFLNSFFKANPDDWTEADARLYYKFMQLNAMLRASTRETENRSDFEKQGGKNIAVENAIQNVVDRYGSLQISDKDMRRMLNRVLGPGAPEMFEKSLDTRGPHRISPFTFSAPW